jgi:hypothetical protein
MVKYAFWHWQGAGSIEDVALVATKKKSVVGASR